MSGAGGKLASLGVALGPALALVMALTVGPALAAGSWVATAPGVRVALVEREVASATLPPPAAVSGGTIDSVGWRFRLPPGASVQARLCHAEGCMALGAAQGRSRALAGLPADAPLHFRFALAPVQRQAVAVQGLQVIVNYR
ncbi:flagellar protein FlhE [Halomonas sp. LBP4]|uniref:flagellar protein FlhE n=1 Tax=Halomonas sp. LBP4 TaxID=2044917 RepID=UPI000D76889A|nr:flagellar protein FlhE [Halomonas sp. LBP4]PXX96420.1 flagellar FlhE [Halomonas sp. LBP4]